MVRENPLFEYVKSSILSVEEFKTRIENEKKTSLLSALFILHGYIEAILLDWFNYLGNGRPEKVSEEIQKNIERIGFLNFAQLHLSMGNIPQSLFARIKKFNTARNDLAHGIREINLESKKTKKGIEVSIKEGKIIYKELFNLYRKVLDEKSKKFILDETNKK